MVHKTTLIWEVYAQVSPGAATNRLGAEAESIGSAIRSHEHVNLVSDLGSFTLCV